MEQEITGRDILAFAEIASEEMDRIEVQMYWDGSIFVKCRHWGDKMAIMQDDAAKLAQFIVTNQEKVEKNNGSKDV